jgi:hypothetical protein
MRLKHSVVALAAAGLLAVQAHAGEAAVEAAKLTPVAAAPEAAQAAFSAADFESLFVKGDAPVQVAALSAKEMSETEGAAAPVIWLAGSVIVRGALHYFPRHTISQGQAVNTLRHGGSVIANNQRFANQLANNAWGKNNVIRHQPHGSSRIFNPHFQHTNRNQPGHVFWRR